MWLEIYIYITPLYSASLYHYICISIIKSLILVVTSTGQKNHLYRKTTCLQHNSTRVQNVVIHVHTLDVSLIKICTNNFFIPIAIKSQLIKDRYTIPSPGIHRCTIRIKVTPWPHRLFMVSIACVIPINMSKVQEICTWTLYKRELWWYQPLQCSTHQLRQNLVCKLEISWQEIKVDIIILVTHI